VTKHTIDILIEMAAERIGCLVVWTTPSDPMAPREVRVSTATGDEVRVQIAAKSTLEAVIGLLLAAYGTAGGEVE
jgi:hypothetical protein